MACIRDTCPQDPGIPDNRTGTVTTTNNVADFFAHYASIPSVQAVGNWIARDLHREFSEIASFSWDSEIIDDGIDQYGWHRCRPGDTFTFTAFFYDGASASKTLPWRDYRPSAGEVRA